MCLRCVYHVVSGRGCVKTSECESSLSHYSGKFVLSLVLKTLCYAASRKGWLKIGSWGEAEINFHLISLLNQLNLISGVLKNQGDMMNV